MKIAKLLALAATTSLGLAASVACDVEDDGVAERGADKDYCTLTQGYWKTHNAYAKQPKKQDPWPYELEDYTTWCSDGETWLDSLNTPPKGSAYYILHHQYIAAKLNVLGGLGWAHAAESEAWDEIQAANALLSDCTIDADEFAEAIELSESLDAFNNGIWGPGHCDEK